MSTIIDTLVTNRQAACNYPYTDWNRVETAAQYVINRLTAAGYGTFGSATFKTNWATTDKPLTADMTRYLKNITDINAIGFADADPPTSMAGIDYNDANNIEKVLVQADFGLSATLYGQPCCGAAETGGDYF